MPSKMGEYFTVIQLGSGESYAQLIMGYGTMLGGCVVALVRGPVFALILFCYTPVLIITSMLFGGAVGKG